MAVYSGSGWQFTVVVDGSLQWLWMAVYSGSGWQFTVVVDGCLQW